GGRSFESWRLAHEKPVSDRAEAPDVDRHALRSRTAKDLRSPPLIRTDPACHVVAEHWARDSKIEQHGRTVGSDADVGRLDVAMHDSVRCRGGGLTVQMSKPTANV